MSKSSGLEKGTDSLMPRPGTAGNRRRAPMDVSGETISVFNMMSMGAGKQPLDSFSGPASPIKYENTHTNKDNGEETAAGRDIAKSIIKGDSILRIMTENAAISNNEVIGLADKGNLVRIADLVEAGFDWGNCRGMNRFTPLHYASARGHVTVVSMLLRAHAPMLHSQNDAGETPLHLAAYNNRLLTVEQLLDCGADIHAETSDGETALCYAARKASPAVCRLLLNKGADMNRKDRFGESAWNYAEDGDEYTLSVFTDFTSMGMRQKQMGALFGAGTGGEGEEKPGEKKSDEEHGSSKCDAFVETNKDNLLWLAFTFLSVEEVCRGAIVSRIWQAATQTRTLWVVLGLKRWEVVCGDTVAGTKASPALRKNSKTRLAGLLKNARDFDQEQVGEREQLQGEGSGALETKA